VWQASGQLRDMFGLETIHPHRAGSADSQRSQAANAHGFSRLQTREVNRERREQDREMHKLSFSNNLQRGIEKEIMLGHDWHAPCLLMIVLLWEREQTLNRNGSRATGEVAL
jgi:hypothetical protein